jgi:hypothetical protein
VPLRFTAAVCGICVSITASLASSVPATDVRKPPSSDSAGISLKLLGNLSGPTNFHGPSYVLLSNQRPDCSTYISPLANSRSHGVSVFSTYIILPPTRLTHLTLPSVEIDSVASVVVIIIGVLEFLLSFCLTSVA